MQRKGFTLVELLLVIVILAILATITLPNIFDMLNSSKEKKYQEYENLLTESLKTYAINYQEDLNEGYNVITWDNLLKVNRNINIGDCIINNTDASLIIIKNGNNYLYKVCMDCGQTDQNGFRVLYGKDCVTSD